MTKVFDTVFVFDYQRRRIIQTLTRLLPYIQSYSISSQYFLFVSQRIPQPLFILLWLTTACHSKAPLVNIPNRGCKIIRWTKNRAHFFQQKGASLPRRMGDDIHIVNDSARLLSWGLIFLFILFIYWYHHSTLLLFILNRSLEKACCHFLMTAIRKTAFYMLDS